MANSFWDYCKEVDLHIDNPTEEFFRDSVALERVYQCWKLDRDIEFAADCVETILNNPHD